MLKALYIMLGKEITFAENGNFNQYGIFLAKEYKITFNYVQLELAYSSYQNDQ